MPDASVEQAFVFRAFDPDSDVPAVVRLLRAVELVDWDGEETSEEDVRAQLDWAGHEPTRDRWVVEASNEPGALIGYGLVWAKTPRWADVFAATHPSYRRRGIGSRLLALSLERARSLGVERIGVWANTLNAPATAFLYTHHFQAVSSYWDLLAPADMPFVEPRWPDGYTARPYDEVANPRLLVQVLNESYEDLWGHGLSTEETIETWLSTVSPGNVILVFGPDGAAAGVCRFHKVQGEEPAGYIDAPGVVPRHRGADLYLPLFLTAMQRLWSDTRFPVRLESWGDDPRVIEQYRSLGLSSIRHYIGFGMDLRRGDRDGGSP